MSNHDEAERGEQGTEGPRGQPGERGAQGSPGPGGGQGIEGPPGDSAEGAQGIQGERGQRGRRAPLRWAPAVGFAILALGLIFLIFRVQTTCIDNQASTALRNQWTRVAEIIDGTNKQPGQPGYIKPQDAGKMFGDSYRQALEEAGPAPDCRGF